MRNDDDIRLHNYQDDFDTEFDDVDPILEEETDDPTEELGIPPDELKDELEKFDKENDDYDDTKDVSENLDGKEHV
jgi:hypothetical protein